eukprot:m.47411 g.47411  ORF g.47411 m.47411 type:complete len:108 (-) comp13220_c1_seq13:255-578(-)
MQTNGAQQRCVAILANCIDTGTCINQNLDSTTFCQVERAHALLIFRLNVCSAGYQQLSNGHALPGARGVQSRPAVDSSTFSVCPTSMRWLTISTWPLQLAAMSGVQP